MLQSRGRRTNQALWAAGVGRAPLSPWVLLRGFGLVSSEGPGNGGRGIFKYESRPLAFPIGAWRSALYGEYKVTHERPAEDSREIENKRVLRSEYDGNYSEEAQLPTSNTDFEYGQWCFCVGSYRKKRLFSANKATFNNGLYLSVIRASGLWNTPEQPALYNK